MEEEAPRTLFYVIFAAAVIAFIVIVYFLILNPSIVIG